MRSVVSGVVVAALAAALVLSAAGPQAAGRPVKGIWVVRHALGSPASVARLVADARDAGFDTLLVQVRGRGDAYYASRLEPRATPLDRGPTGFDPLGEVILRAHGAGLRVHAWLNVNLVASVHDLPRHPRHVVRRHPEWLMAPRGFATSPGALDARKPGYAARLAAWTRANAPAVEGLFTSPVPREAAAYLAEVIGDLVARYPVDGVHLDYVRYPDESFDYSASALREFRAEVAPELSRDERARLDARAVRSPLTYSDMFPMRWDTFRRSRLTALVMRVRTEVKRHRPEALVTAAVVADPEGALTTRLQDWPSWAGMGLLDAVCPMAYTGDPVLYSRLIDTAVRAAGPVPLWAGVGAFRLSPEQAAAHASVARQLGAQGFLLFSWDSISDAAGGALDYLARVQRALGDAAPSPLSR